MYSKRKIEEAAFFLERLEGCSVTSVEFTYFFSAAISAFRSITFAFQKEYKGRTGYEDIYKRLQDNLKEDAFARSLVESRNIVLKEGALVPITIYTVVNHDSGETLEWEMDGVPFPDNVYFGLKLSAEYPVEGSAVPLGSSKEEIFTAGCKNLEAAVGRMMGAKNKEVACRIKLEADGLAYQMNDFFGHLKELLKLFREAHFDLNAVCPTLAFFEQVKRYSPKASN